MNKIANVMTKNPICLSEHANVHKARMIMAEKSIRHIPVKSNDGNQLVGMLSQKSVLSNAIKIINQRGFENLEHEEKSQSIENIMNKSPLTVDIEDSLLTVANKLIENKSGCVAVLQKEQLIGVMTSNDFVKLAAKQLSETAE